MYKRQQTWKKDNTDLVADWKCIAGLQSIPGYLKYKDAAAMLVVQKREANE